jgi:sporadic carbohydrate cluster 2OG-Fe(II) oxygenase
MWQRDFERDGYAIVDVPDRAGLESLRQRVFGHVSEGRNPEGLGAAAFFNGFHRLGYSPAETNSIVKDLVFKFSVAEGLNREMHSILKPHLDALIGRDVLAQKRANFVAQLAGDTTNNAPVHTDSPENSYFEVICWLPLVDAYGSKTMGLLNREQSEEAFEILSERGQEAFTAHFLSEAARPVVPFGKVLYFHTNLVHGPFENKENETRWSINIRYKSLFTPSGRKNTYDFFDLISLSSLSRIGIDASTRDIGL